MILSLGCTIAEIKTPLGTEEVSITEEGIVFLVIMMVVHSVLTH